MRRYKYVSQIDLRDCGVAALASVAKHYGSDFSLAHLRELAKTTKEGTTALGIVEAAKAIGFETRAIQANMELFDMADIPYPLLFMLTKKANSRITMLSTKPKKIILLSVTLIRALGSLKCPKRILPKSGLGLLSF